MHTLPFDVLQLIFQQITSQRDWNALLGTCKLIRSYVMEQRHALVVLARDPTLVTDVLRSVQLLRSLSLYTLDIRTWNVVAVLPCLTTLEIHCCTEPPSRSLTPRINKTIASLRLLGTTTRTTDPWLLLYLNAVTHLQIGSAEDAAAGTREPLHETYISAIATRGDTLESLSVCFAIDHEQCRAATAHMLRSLGCLHTLRLCMRKSAARTFADLLDLISDTVADRLHTLSLWYECAVWYSAHPVAAASLTRLFTRLRTNLRALEQFPACGLTPTHLHLLRHLQHPPRNMLTVFGWDSVPDPAHVPDLQQLTLTHCEHIETRLPQFRHLHHVCVDMGTAESLLPVLCAAALPHLTRVTLTQAPFVTARPSVSVVSVVATLLASYPTLIALDLSDALDLAPPTDHSDAVPHPRCALQMLTLSASHASPACAQLLDCVLPCARLHTLHLSLLNAEALLAFSERIPLLPSSFALHLSVNNLPDTMQVLASAHTLLADHLLTLRVCAVGRRAQAPHAPLLQTLPPLLRVCCDSLRVMHLPPLLLDAQTAGVLFAEASRVRELSIGGGGLTNGACACIAERCHRYVAMWS